MKSTPTVLVTEECYNRGKSVYDDTDDLEIISAPIEEDRLSEMITKHKAFAVVLGPETYAGPIYQAMQEKGVLARFGVGCDGVDLEKSRKNGLFVTNTPDVLETTVAEFTVFLAGEVLRRPGRANHEVKKEEWNPVPGKDLRDKTWAVIGLGNIGKKVSKILSFGFGVDVYALKKSITDRDKIREKYGVKKVSTDYTEIAPFADIISLHLPANEDTYHYMDPKRLHQLPSGAILINTGRGSLIDERALYDVLKSKHVSGAGLDVFMHEPYQPVTEDKDLRDLPNVVLTPHIGSNTGECSTRMTERVIQNIRLALQERYNEMDLVKPK